MDDEMMDRLIRSVAGRRTHVSTVEPDELERAFTEALREQLDGSNATRRGRELFDRGR